MNLQGSLGLNDVRFGDSVGDVRRIIDGQWVAVDVKTIQSIPEVSHSSPRIVKRFRNGPVEYLFVNGKLGAAQSLENIICTNGQIGRGVKEIADLLQANGYRLEREMLSGSRNGVVLQSDYLTVAVADIKGNSGGVKIIAHTFWFVE